MKSFSSRRFILWAGCLVSGLLLAGQPQPTLAQALPPSKPASTTAYPVLINIRGSLDALFFAGGERVKRGQLLAKLERANGSTFYITAPVAGRISAPHLTSGNSIPVHTLLATVEAR